MRFFPENWRKNKTVCTLPNKVLETPKLLETAPEPIPIKVLDRDDVKNILLAKGIIFEDILCAANQKVQELNQEAENIKKDAINEWNKAKDIFEEATVKKNKEIEEANGLLSQAVIIQESLQKF